MPPEIYTPDEPMLGDLDVEARAKGIEPAFAVKGTFFNELRARLGDGWETVRGRLDVDPRLGRYVPFTDYPLADYLRLIEAVARARYPNVSLRQGFRLAARDDFGVFAGTTLGKIVLAAAGDARGAMSAMTAVYTKMAPGDWSVVVTLAEDGTVQVIWENLRGFWEYQLGQVEGLVAAFGGTSSITVTELAPRRIRFDVTIQ